MIGDLDKSKNKIKINVDNIDIDRIPEGIEALTEEEVKKFKENITKATQQNLNIWKQNE